jgi:sirohydrochlorin ferrochelatase
MMIEKEEGRSRLREAPLTTDNGQHPTGRTALLLIAHGSRQEEANADLYQLAEALRRGGRYEVVEAAFLELAEPTIAQGAARCIAQGARRVILLPYFLSAGIHVRRDLAALRAALAAEHPGAEFRLAEPLGPHPLLLEVVAQRARQAEEG